MSRPFPLIQRDAALRLKLDVVELLLTVKRMHTGWDLDTEGWIVKLKNGKTIGLTTNHGSIVQWTQQEMQEDLDAARTFLSDLRDSLHMLGATTPKVATISPKPPAMMLLVREHRAGFKESLATETMIHPSLASLALWIQDKVGFDSSDNGSGRITTHYIKSALKISDTSVEDTRARGWNFTREISLGSMGVIGYINLEKLEDLK